MVDILDKTLVYVTTDEKALVERLFRIKPAEAFYYREGKKVAYHWRLSPVTIERLKLTPK